MFCNKIQRKILENFPLNVVACLSFFCSKLFLGNNHFLTEDKDTACYIPTELIYPKGIITVALVFRVVV